jgi:hypothetical protein
MSLHHDINALYATMGYRWTDACEILASAKEAAERAKPTMVRSELVAMIAKLGVIETDTMALLSAIHEAKRLLIAKQQQIDNQSIDILANLTTAA